MSGSKACSRNPRTPRLRDGVGVSGWLRVAAYPLDGAPGYALWTVEDITSRRRMEQTIHDEQAKLVDFLENAPIGFYSVDQNGRFVFANNAFAGWLGRHLPSKS